MAKSKAARAEKRRRQSQAAFERRERDRALAPLSAARMLGVPIAVLAEAMRSAGVDGPLTDEQAVQWAGDPASAPEWLMTVWGERLAVAAEAEFQRQRQHEEQALARLAEEQAELAAEQSAEAKVRAGERHFSDREWEYVRGWAFYAARDLARSDPGDEVDEFDEQVLAAVGVVPGDHETWPFHARGCDGEGPGHCVIRSQEIRARRRAQAIATSVEKEVALAQLDLVPGQVVTTWRGARVGAVVKVNKVSVKVRMVGFSRDKYALIEKNLDPRYVRLDPGTLPARPQCGAEVKLRDRYGHIRQATVTQVDGPLFEVSYSLKSGEQRTGWYDLTAITEG